MANTRLDVDDNIIKSNLLLLENKQEDEDLDQLIKELETCEIPSIVVRPLPGVCVKTRSDKGEKVFLNICHTSEIPPPANITDDQLRKILSGDPMPWMIPMSIGHERFEPDKTGVECQTYDAVINTQFFERHQANPPFFVYIVNAMLTAVGEKYDQVLDAVHFVILKNKKAMGRLRDHRIQKREPQQAPPLKKKLIQEVSSKKSANDNDTDPENAQKKTVPESKYVILKKPREGQTEDLIGFFKLPHQTSLKDIRVDVAEDRLQVEASDYLADIFLPLSIDQTKTTASLDPGMSILRLDMPVVPS